MTLKAPFSHLQANAPERFSKAALEYDHHARVQKHAAVHLAAWLDQVLPTPFDPKVCIDVGSGTGFLTEYLLKRFPQSPVHAVDLAPGMLAHLKTKLASPQLHTHVLNGEELAFEHLWVPNHSLLVSGMCAQWFDNLELALRRWLSVSNTVAFSVLLDGSFQAWHAAHEETKQVCGLRRLPQLADIETMLHVFSHEGLLERSAHHSKDFLDHHPDGLSFARSLRAIGADVPNPAHKPANLRKVFSALGTACTMNYRVGFFLLERP